MTSALGVHALAAAMLRCRVFSMQKQGAQSSPAWWCLNPEVSFAADLHGCSCTYFNFPPILCELPALQISGWLRLLRPGLAICCGSCCAGQDFLSGCQAAYAAKLPCRRDY